jgi:hypothetical protein
VTATRQQQHLIRSLVAHISCSSATTPQAFWLPFDGAADANFVVRFQLLLLEA